MHILMVDNDADDRELFLEAFNAIAPDMVITISAYCYELFPKYKNSDEHLPDIIFLDLNMPQKNGIECLDEIKSIPWLNDIPVIIYSTSAQPTQVDATYEKGASLYVKKPSSFGDLKTILTKILQLNTEDYFPQASKDRFLIQV